MSNKKVSFENRARMLYNVPELMSAGYETPEEKAYLKGSEEFKKEAIKTVQVEIDYIRDVNSEAALIAHSTFMHLQEKLRNLKFNLELP